MKVKTLGWVVVSLVMLSFGCNTQEPVASAEEPAPEEGKGDSFTQAGPASDSCPDPSTLSRPEFDTCRGADGRFVASECCMVRCTNTWVNEDLNGDLFEEGYGSAFEVDEEGFPMVDGDSTETMIELVPFRESDAQTELKVGQMRFEEEEDATFEMRVEDNGDTAIRVWRATRHNGDIFEFRVLDEPRLGILMYQDADDQSGRMRHYSTSDCRDGNEPPFF